MGRPIIAIARQYGSGGKTIGQMLADDLKINCYEREIISMASEDSGISESLFAKVDERIGTNSIFKMKHIYRGNLVSPESDGFTSDQNLFNYQAKIIKQRVSFTEKETIKYIEKTNKYRADYYKYYTGKDWYDLRNYDLALDSSKLGFEGCVEEIKAYMKIRFQA